MFFSESEQLVKDNPESSDLLRALDDFLATSSESTLLVPRRVASHLRSSRTQVAALLEIFAESNVLTGHNMIECDCGLMADESQAGQACTSCEDTLSSSELRRCFRFSDSSKATLQEKSRSSAKQGDSPEKQSDTRAQSLSVSEMNTLKVAYSGVWGTKVIWLAAFTFAPLAIGLKVPGLRIHLGLATLVYAAYHALGAWNWIRLKQLSQAPKAHQEKESGQLWRNISLRHRITTPLSYAVLTLLLLTILAKIDLGIGSSSHPICLPDVVYTIVAVSPPGSCL